MRLLDRVSTRIVGLVERYLPEPFSFAILMTAVTFVLALALTDAGPTEVLTAWGDGLSLLLAFITQVCLTLLFAYTLSHVGPVPRLLRRFARLPRSPTAACIMVTVFAGAVSLISWPLGLVMGGLVARAVGQALRQRGVRVHYPLLGAAAYGGFVVWHMGYSASAPLFVATPGNAMEAQIGALIPITDTVFTIWNVTIAVITLLTVAITAALLHPRDANAIIECPEGKLLDSDDGPPGDASRAHGFAARFENSRVPVLVLGLLVSAYLASWFWRRGLELDLNIVNWSFLAACLLLAGSARELVNIMLGGGRAVVPILLQYPIYAGIMGIMLKTGLVSVVANAFASIATAKTLPFVAFLAAAIINFFVPSGGAQWSVQGPAFVEAARMLGTELPLIVMGVAYGDQWTNIIHPFIVIPLLIMTGLTVKQVFGYSTLLFVVAGVPLGLGLLIIG